MEIGTNTYSKTQSYTMQNLIDLSKGKIIKDLELLKENKMKTGGSLDNENLDMVLNNNNQISHHTKELPNAVKKNKVIPAWVVAKVNRSTTDLSDATHYLEGAKYKKGGNVSEKENKFFILKKHDGYGKLYTTDYLSYKSGTELLNEFKKDKDLTYKNNAFYDKRYNTIKFKFELKNLMAKGGNLGFCYSIGGL
jgi:ribosomal protein L39E